MSFVFVNKPLNDGDYYVSSNFGYRESVETENGPSTSDHRGIDLATRGVSKPIFAVADGTIERVNYSTGWGYYVRIDHGDGVKTLYAHMISRSPFNEGDKVRAGEQIGSTGSTGVSTGIHLHFELILNGVQIDPAPYINATGPTILSSSYSSTRALTSGINFASGDYRIIDASGTTKGQRVLDRTYQPIHAFINIYVGQNQLLLATDPARPNIIRSFEYTRLDGAGETATFTIFDDNWQTIEQVLSDNYDNIYIEYGYWGTGITSERHKHLLLNYRISFESTGTILSVESVTEGTVQNLDQKTIEGVNTANPTEAVKAICRALGYIVLNENFDESLDITTDSDTGVIKGDDKFTLVNEFPITYIKETIIPLSYSQNGEVFRFWVDVNNRAYFKQISYDPGDDATKSNLRTYIFQKGYDSAVLDFTIDVKSVFGGRGTYNLATEYRSTVFDPETKEETTNIVNTENVMTVATGTRTTVRPDQSSIVVGSSGYSASQAYSKAHYTMKSMINDAYEATLTIIGDPTIKPYEFIRVINITDDGYLHHTSGVYWISGVSDSITNGSMTTSLKLLKNATAGDIEGLTIINPKPDITFVK